MKKVLSFLILVAIIVFMSCESEYDCRLGAYMYSREHDTNIHQYLCVSSCDRYVNGDKFTYMAKSDDDIRHYKQVYRDAEFIGCADEFDVIVHLDWRGDTVSVEKPNVKRINTGQ